MSIAESPLMWSKYWESSKLHTGEHSALLLATEEVLGGFERKMTLEVGAGRGIDSIRMAQRGAIVHTVDSSAGSIKVTRIFAEQADISMNSVKADAGRLPFEDNSFDLVFSQGLMEHPGEREKLLSEQVRVTKPGGFVLIDVPNLYSILTLVREARIRLGCWPFGKEYPFSLWELEKFMKDVGLRPVKAYGWMKSRLKGNRQVISEGTAPNDYLKNLQSPDFFTRNIEMNMPWFMNSIGVIAQKSYYTNS